MEITILGTSSMVPTKARNQVGVFLRFETHGILFDCGEGIQRQFAIAGLKITSINVICLSHWHGDHVLGLPGLLQSLSASQYQKQLTIIGPKGTKKFIGYLFKAFEFENTLDLEIIEAKPGTVLTKKAFTLKTAMVDHGVPTLGYRFEESERRKVDTKKAKAHKISGPQLGRLQDGASVTVKGKLITPDMVSHKVPGKIISYITDTRPCDSCLGLSHNADVLICESTYASKHKDKSEQYFHMTAKDAATIAAHAGVKKLYLIHFSGRYKTTDELEDEAREVFDATTCASDFMTIKV